MAARKNFSTGQIELPPRNETESSFRIRTGRDMEREGTMAARKRLSPAQVINRLRKAEPGRPNQSLLIGPPLWYHLLC